MPASVQPDDGATPVPSPHVMSLERHFDPTFAAGLALREKQIQQSYRPVIGVHKWFARRPGSLFRNLLLAKFNGTEGLAQSYCRAHRFLDAEGLPITNAAIPPGDETDRLHRWGYRYYREMFNERQLLVLGLLHRRLLEFTNNPMRHALLTVFSDILRYQNMLCRYDTGALKCQDIFSVHGFPVGLVQCENNLIGIPGVGGGGFRHFVEKYRRAKAYCRQPFETRHYGGSKHLAPIAGERIEATSVERPPTGLIWHRPNCRWQLRKRLRDLSTGCVGWTRTAICSPTCNTTPPPSSTLCLQKTHLSRSLAFEP